ncbi:hypothetical protein GTY54_37860 [Streptomyces sp. SID625]|nr:hypothetical protein [Streptomyces sp. SID625]
MQFVVIVLFSAWVSAAAAFVLYAGPPWQAAGAALARLISGVGDKQKRLR